MLFCPAALSCPSPPVIMAQGRYQCPNNLAELTPLLLCDLPSYANRAAQRRRTIRDLNYSIYLAAGQPDATPIAIDNPEYTPLQPQSAPQQLFISTLEKRYQNRQATDYQRFHWLFLSYSRQGSWQLSLLYSRLGKNAQDPTLLPAVDSRDTPVGEAISYWLRDCRAGRIKP